MRDRKGTYTTFDAPGAGTGNNQGTCWAGCAINDAGTIAGTWVDPNGIGHGLARDASSGAITSFDPPGAVAVYVTPGSISPTGLITGTYADASGLSHGFLRLADGKITTFAAPGAGTQSGQGTSPSGMNEWGAIAGNYVDSAGANHGFLRDLSGSITTFDVPNAGAGASQGTVPTFINASGEIVGCYSDANGVGHAFEGVPGSFKTIDAPRPGTQSTCAYSISAYSVLSAIDWSRSGADSASSQTTSTSPRNR